MNDEEDFDKLFSDYLKLWPAEIDVSQSFVDGQQSPFKDLIHAHDQVELVLEKKQDEKLWVLDWCVFKHLNDLAKRQDQLMLADLDVGSLRATYNHDVRKWREEFGS